MAQKNLGSGGNERRELQVGRRRERGDGGEKMGKVERMETGSRWERNRRARKTRKRLVGWRFRRRRK